MHLMEGKAEMIDLKTKNRRKPRSKKSLDDFLSQKNHESKGMRSFL